MRSYTVIGAGAVGLLYGARLAEAGHPVRWLVRSGADEIRARGIAVETEGRTIRLDPSDVDMHTDPAGVPASDVVVVALKTTANDDLERTVAPAVADGATVAVFQNGLGVEQRVRAAVPSAGPVVGVLCFVCAHRTGPGRADHLDYGAVTVGELGAVDRSEPAASIADDLGRAGFETTVVDDLGVARWRKLVWNIPFNGLSVLLDASTDAMLADPAMRSAVADLMDEVIAASVACGHGVDAAFRDQMLAMTDAMAPYAPSMKLDHDAGRPLELAAIYDAPLAAAAAAGAPMRRVELLARSLRFLDGRSGGGEPGDGGVAS